ncbi:hypothetical protein CEXT_189311 [Caerostris extrusa]|uniref:Uncharacterized protein n=1 Tax=Caerostris extrusa TaxID=172846 RepID=A0AAV4P7R9_CAEEX|nr:hypothetical protein CEXT_189311 [Caerostris extrusa]
MDGVGDTHDQGNRGYRGRSEEKWTRLTVWSKDEAEPPLISAETSERMNLLCLMVLSLMQAFTTHTSRHSGVHDTC